MKELNNIKYAVVDEDDDVYWAANKQAGAFYKTLKHANNKLKFTGKSGRVVKIYFEELKDETGGSSDT